MVFKRRLFCWFFAIRNTQGLPLLLEEIGVFLGVLDRSPPPIICQRKLEEQCAGLHRVALVELLNLLLVPSSPYIEEKLLAESTPTKLVKLFFQFPWNSILQGAIFRSLQVYSAFILGLRMASLTQYVILLWIVPLCWYVFEVPALIHHWVSCSM
jgi:hypothetical protein